MHTKQLNDVTDSPCHNNDYGKVSIWIDWS